MAGYWFQQTLDGVRNSLKGVVQSAESAIDIIDGLVDRLTDIEQGWDDQRGEFVGKLPEDQMRQVEVEQINQAIQQLQAMQGMQGVVKALQQLTGSITGSKQAALNPITMEEEYSKELLISEASILMDKMMGSWPELVVDDITNLGTRAWEYKNGKVHTGEIGWHLTVGSAVMGIGRQVKIVMPIKNGFLQMPTEAETPLGEKVSLNPVAFSNWVRLGVK